MSEKEYKMTKEQCRDMISGVCKQCGGELTPIETVDNADNPTHWAGCEKCQTFCWGVDPTIQEIAREMVEEGELEPYSFIDKPGPDTDEEEKSLYIDKQTAGAYSIVSKIIDKIDEREG